jgi:signal transduction histidine kinase
MEVLNSHLEGRTTHYEAEHRFLAKSGRWIWVLDKGKVTHRDGQGHPLRVVGTYLDITEAKQIQAERLLIEQQKQQVWRAESLSRMAGGIAHHFNNLLGAVIGNLELALDDLPPQEEKPRLCLGQAMKASRRAAEISELMLAYLGQTTGKTEPIDLAEATREALRLLIPSVPKNVHLKADLPPHGPIILADGVRAIA